MATANIYRDTRRQKMKPDCPVKIVINHKSVPVMIDTGITATDEEWEEIISPDTRKAIYRGFSSLKKDYKRLNNELQMILSEIRNLIHELDKAGYLKLYSSADIKREYQKTKMKVYSEATFSEYATMHRNSFKKKSNQEKYDTAFSRLNDFARWKNAPDKEKEEVKKDIIIQNKKNKGGKNKQSKKKATILFEEITYDWLKEFDLFLSETGTPSINGRRPIMNCIRSVFNAAHKAKIIPNDLYPFESFSVKKAKTRKRTLPIDVIRKIRDLEVEDGVLKKARDYFMLSFYLIGINPVDMYEILNTIPRNVSLTESNYIQDGILHYKRSKSGRLYDIKITKEAREIINRNRGKEKLLCWCDDFNSYNSFYSHMYGILKKLGEVINFPRLTQYYSRHTWSSIAKLAGVPKDIIACALGHEEEGDDITWGYIELPEGVIDKANQDTIAYLMADKQEAVPTNISEEELLILKRLGFEVKMKNGIAAIEKIQISK